MAVPAPPMSRATSSQHPATTASATADGAVAGGDALPGDDDAPDAPHQEAEEAVVEATDRDEGVVEASEAALAPPAPQPPAGHAGLARRHVDRSTTSSGGRRPHALSCACPGRTPVMRVLRPTDGLGVLLRRHPSFVRPQVPMHGDPSAGSPLPDAVRAEFRHARDAFHDATRAAVSEASEKARAAGRVRRVRRRTAQDMKESETCRQ
eukprot:jgi/Tetstr1/437344/TSEL_026029.t1